MADMLFVRAEIQYVKIKTMYKKKQILIDNTIRGSISKHFLVAFSFTCYFPYLCVSAICKDKSLFFHGLSSFKNFGKYLDTFCMPASVQ